MTGNPTADVRTKSIRLLTKLGMKNPQMRLTENGKTIVLLSDDSQFQKVDIGTTKMSAVRMSAKADVNSTQEQKSAYDRIYYRESKRFIDPNLNGVDFKYFTPTTSNFWEISIMVLILHCSQQN